MIIHDFTAKEIKGEETKIIAHGIFVAVQYFSVFVLFFKKIAGYSVKQSVLYTYTSQAEKIVISGAE